MAIYHLSCQVISRKAGRSSVAASAYRAGARITDARTGLTHDFTRKGGVEESAVILPDGAPSEWSDRAKLWNAVEASERRGDARLCREFDVALPIELGEAERWALARRFARSLADQGMCVDLAMHNPKDGHNPHFHAMATMRPCDGSGFLPKSYAEYLLRDRSGNERWATSKVAKELDGWAKVYTYKDGSKLTMAEAKATGLDPTGDRRRKQPVSRKVSRTASWDSQEALEGWRELWQEQANDALERAGASARIDHRSNEARGIEAAPTRHEGVAVRAMEAKAMAEMGEDYEPVTEKRAENRAIGEANARNHGRVSANLSAPPAITVEEARADVAALAAALPDASAALDVLPSEAMELQSASEHVSARPLAGGGHTSDPTADAANDANSAMRDAWKGGARTVAELFEAALARLRSYVARLLVLMERCRSEADGVGRDEAARWALSHEPRSPRPDEENADAKDWQLQRELGLSFGGMGRRRTPGL